MTEPTQSLVFRAPSVSNAPPNSAFQLPPVDFLTGTWHIIQSTLPMWKSRRNVRITYKALPDPPGTLDDLVEYQSLTGEKLKTVCGIDTPNETYPGSYDWRGKGWLKVASSHWEVLGYGTEEGGWAVTYFAKTLFTPAGIDVYSRDKRGLSDGLLQRIQEAMKKTEDARCNKLLAGVFTVTHD